MAITVTHLAEMVGGEVLGNGAAEISGAATLDEARRGDITLIDSPDKIGRLDACAASAVVVPRGVAESSLPAVVVDNVHQAFTSIVLRLRPPRRLSRLGVSAAAVVASSAQLHGDIEVHPFATIGDDVEIGEGSTIHSNVHIMPGCKIGRDVTLLPGVVLYENTIIGDRVRIHAGAVIGGHGFGYELVDGRLMPSAQLGNVEIGADVEIGAGTTIDRGTYGATTIGEGTKIDNMVMIAHNCRIGRHNLLCSQVGIAGSSSTGDYVVMAGQVGVRDHVHVGSRAQLGAKAGVSHDVEEGEQMLGVPATKAREQKLKQAALSKLPELRRQVKSLARIVEQNSPSDSPSKPSAAA
jgi:UDP-3-O-[3-hydroxymyristoyl] glucosamine N-acyltransferase